MGWLTNLKIRRKLLLALSPLVVMIVLGALYSSIASRKIESWEETIKEVRALGSDGTAHAINVGRWSDCDRLCEEVYARWGRADVLINNAGMSPLAPSLLETSEALFDKC